MRLKLFLVFLPLVINVYSEVHGPLSYSRSLHVWGHGVSHPSHRVPKPVPNPSLVHNFEPSPDAPEITTEIIEEPAGVKVPPNFILPSRNPDIQSSTPILAPVVSTAHPVTVIPNQIRPSYIRPPLLPRPIPKPHLVRPAPVPDISSTTMMEPNEDLIQQATEPLIPDEPEQNEDLIQQTTERLIPEEPENNEDLIQQTTERLIPEGPQTRPPFQFIHHTQEPVTNVLIPEITTSIAVEQSTDSSIQTQLPIEIQPGSTVILDNEQVLIGYLCARSDGYFRFPDKCSAFVECRNSVAFSYKCPEGLHFNPNKVWPGYPCAYPFEVECLKNPNNTVTFIITTPASAVTEINENPLPPPVNSEGVVLIGYSCAQPDGYFSYPNECESFVECRNNLAVPKVCPNGLHFNSNITWPDYPCASPAEVRCDSSIPNTSETKGESNDNNDHLVQVPTELKEPSTYAPYPASTSRFPFYPRPQPTRLPLHPKPNREPFSTVRTPNKQPLVPWPTSVMPLPHPNGNDQPLPPLVNHYNCVHADGYFGFPDVCDAYIECQKYKGIRHSCPGGLYFNPNAVWPEFPCRPLSEVSCGMIANPTVPVITSTIAPTPDVTENIEVSTSRWSRPQPTRSPLRPEPNREPISTTQPPILWPSSTIRTPLAQRPLPLVTPNPHGNGVILPLNPPFVADHGQVLPDYNCVHTDAYFGYPDKCDSFIECRKNMAVRYLCPGGLHFNPNAVWPEYPCASPFGVQCGTDPNPTVPVITSTLAPTPDVIEYLEVSTSRWPRPQPTRFPLRPEPNWVPISTVQPSTRQPPNPWHTYHPDPLPVVTAAPNPDGNGQHLPHPTADCPSRHGYFPMNDGECGRYIMCLEGVATIMNCPQGLVFSTDTSSCDWPENVPSCNPDVFRGFTCPAPELDEDGEATDEMIKFRYGESCNQYVACHRGHPRLLSCDPGYSFEVNMQTCISSRHVLNCNAAYLDKALIVSA